MGTLSLRLCHRMHWLMALLVLCVHSAAPVAARSTATAPVGVQLLHSDTAGLTLHFTTPAYTVGTTAGALPHTLHMAGAVSVGSAGAPALPTVAVLVGVPATATPQLKVQVGRRQQHPTPLWLAPVPTPVPAREPLQPGSQHTRPDPRIYASPTAYPPTRARIAGDGWLREQRVLRIEISPFAYLPTNGTLYWYEDVTVQVQFGSPTPATASVPLSTSAFESALQQHLLNYAEARAWRNPAPPLAQLSDPDPTPRYRMEISSDGFYRVLGAELAAAGMELATIDPDRLHLTCGGQPAALLLEGSDDGRLDPDDTLIFYAEQFRGTLMQEKYTRTNVCWLAMHDTPGLRIARRSAAPDSSLPALATFSETIRAERSLTWFPAHFTSEETWFWQRIQTDGSSTQRTYSISLPDPATTPFSATVRGELVASAYGNAGPPNYHTRAELNGALVAEAYWGRGGAADVWQFAGQVPHTAVRAGSNQLALTIFTDAAVSFNDMLFDWFEVGYPRQLRASNNQLTFTPGISGTSTITVDGFLSDDLLTFDLSNPAQPVLLTDTTVAAGAQGLAVQFASAHHSTTRFATLARSVLRPPDSLRHYTPPDLGRNRGADYIIITHHAFRDTVQRLADHRAAQGKRVAVVDVADLYNQFNNGVLHPDAIRRFLAYTMQAWQPPAPAAVVLVGDGHWNMLNHAPATYNGGTVYMPPNLAWVDPYQGETDATSQLVMLTENDLLPDMAIGRLPVNTPAELDTIIDAIIQFEQDSTLPATERPRRVVFAADNVPDPAGDFLAQTEAVIARHIPSSVPVERLYLNQFCPQGGACPALNRAIAAALNHPQTLFLGYNGHAAIERWAAEGIWQNSNLPQLNNGTRRPVIVSMTCLDGYWHYPGRAGLNESMLRQASGGIVAAYTPTGLGVASGHEWLQNGFFRAVYQQRAATLGDAVLASKVSLYLAGGHDDLLYTFSILGDPALQLPVATVTQHYLPLVVGNKLP